jgi:hypothetical protein
LVALKLVEKPKNPFDTATFVIAKTSMAEKPFADIDDEETVRALAILEGHTFNVVRAANELFWSREKAWKSYRLSCRDLSRGLKLRPSDQIEIFWWAFVNYVYQFEEKSKLYLNTYNRFAPFFNYLPVTNPGKLINSISAQLKRFTAFRHESLHQWHNPPDAIGQLPLVEFMIENKDSFQRLEDAAYLKLPPKFLFRMTRRGMHSKMSDAMLEMSNLSEELTSNHHRPILLACYKVNSYVQWAKAGHARFKFGK